MAEIVQKLQYGALVTLFAAGLAWGAAGPAARASASPRPFRKASRLRTGGSAVPPALRRAIDLTLGPDWSQQAELAASDGMPGDQFGFGIRLSADGTTAIVGAACAPYDPNTFLCGPGAAYVFTESGGAWTQTAELTASDGADGDVFGASVALSADGTLAFVGAPGHTQTGAVYVFTESGGTWTQQAELTASDGGWGDSFGDAVALSADGRTSLVGAWERNPGTAYVFTESGGTWTQTAELTASDGAAFDYFGNSVTLSTDGTIALVGAEGHSNNTGAAYVFTESGGTWAQQAELTVYDAMHPDLLGNSVALSANGTTALVGANGFYAFTGIAYVFTESGGTWTQQAELPAAADGDDFAVSVALSADGTEALVGADAHNNATGAAYAFTDSGGSWTQTAELTASDGMQDDLFGNGVALSPDGTVALIGASQYFNGGSGKVYVFTQPMADVLFNPSSGPPGTTTHLLGTGFTPGETVDLSIGGRSGTVHAHANGQFGIRLRVPNVPPRRYTLTAMGETSGLSAQTAFTVTSSGPGTMPAGPTSWLVGSH